MNSTRSGRSNSSENNLPPVRNALHPWGRAPQSSPNSSRASSTSAPQPAGGRLTRAPDHRSLAAIGNLGTVLRLPHVHRVSVVSARRNWIAAATAPARRDRSLRSTGPADSHRHQCFPGPSHSATAAPAARSSSPPQQVAQVRTHRRRRRRGHRGHRARPRRRHRLGSGARQEHPDPQDAADRPGRPRPVEPRRQPDTRPHRP